MKATIARTTQHNVKIQNSGGILQSTTPITLKNQVTEIRSIEDLGDVAEVNVSSGSTLVYNAENDKYEVKQLKMTDVNIDILNLDGGVF